MASYFENKTKRKLSLLPSTVLFNFSKREVYSSWFSEEFYFVWSWKLFFKALNGTLLRLQGFSIKKDEFMFDHRDLVI